MYISLQYFTGTTHGVGTFLLSLPFLFGFFWVSVGILRLSSYLTTHVYSGLAAMIGWKTFLSSSAPTSFLISFVVT